MDAIVLLGEDLEVALAAQVEPVARGACGRDDVEDIKSGIAIAKETLQSGKAAEKLEAFIALTNKLAT